MCRFLPPQILCVLLVLAAGTQVGTSESAENHLRNGNFEAYAFDEGPPAQEVPQEWTPNSSDQPPKDPWVRILRPDQDGEAGVELKGGEEPRFLYQDIKISPGAWLLRWKAKGAGNGSVTVVKMNIDGDLLETSLEKFPVTDMADTFELAFLLPENAASLRIWLTPEGSDSTIVFQEMDLSNSSP